MFVTRVISEEGLNISQQGFDLDIRLPWYRSLPLSTINIGELKVDGKLIAPDAIRFELNGKSYALDELGHHPEEWWFVLDSAHLRVSGTEIHPGVEHEVSVGVGIKPPYIPGFYRLTECTKQLVAV